MPPREHHARPTDGARTAAEPRGRGGRARRDAPLGDRDRRRHRDPRRVALLPGLARHDLPRLPRALGKGEPVDAITLANESRSAASRADRRQLARRGARGPRLGDGERRALRADRQGDRQRSAGSSTGRRSRGSAVSESGRRPSSSTRPSRSSSTSPSSGSAATSRRSAPPHRGLRADHEALRGWRRRHRRPAAFATSTGSRRASNRATS